jgi:hypothetical protein
LEVEIGKDEMTRSPARHNRRSFVKVTAAAGLSLPLGLLRVQSVAAEVRDKVGLGEKAKLFLDDEVIAEMKGLRRVLHQPRKAGLIEEADGRPWELGDQISVVRALNSRFHLTYRFHWPDPSVRDLHPSIGADKAHWFRQTTGYAVSEDGIRWSKPVLGLVEGPTGFRRAPESKWADGVFFEPAGFSRANNLGCPINVIQDLGAFGGARDARHRYLVNVVRYGDTHPFAEITDAGLYFAGDVPDVARNPRWRERLETIWEGRRRGPRGPAVRVAGFDEREQVWFECAQGSFGKWLKRGGRDIGRWTSRDLREWLAEELVLPIAEDESRAPEDWVEYMDIRVMRVADVWLGQLVIFHGDRTSPQYEMPTQAGVWRKGTTEMRLILSRDAGKTWRRVCGKEVWLPHHAQDDGYDRLVFTGSHARLGDELWLYYGCWDGDHLVWNKDGTPFYKNRTRMGRTARATLRWNGFVSLRADGSGELVTKPFRPGGRRLAVNAAAGKGSVRVELQGADGKHVPGFGLTDCEPVTGDGIAQRVRWRGGRELPTSLRERPLRLCFEVKQADLFGFEWVE